MGYTRVRYYPGGLAAWREHGLALETVAIADPNPAPTAASWRTPAERAIDAIDRMPPGGLFRGWLALIGGFGVLYWIAAAAGVGGLREGSSPVGGGLQGLLVSLYFSFVTALSIGYGDTTPVGPMRALAVLEGTLGLIVFGALISKLVSRRQESITREIHRITFEDRLGRVRTNLHLVLTELQNIGASCEDRRLDPERLVPRIESMAAVFAGELRTVHDLLYRPQSELPEDVLEAILASLAGVLSEMVDLLAKLPPEKRSSVLGSSLRVASRLAEEVCGECVPRSYAPALKDWMDRIREHARLLA